MSEQFDDPVFGKTKFSDLLGEIHKKSNTKAKQIKLLIDELRPLVKTVGDATVIVPLIKDYLDVGVKNDELLVKIAVVIQRHLQKANDSGTGDFEIPAEEIDELISNYNDNQKSSTETIESAEQKVDELKNVADNSDDEIHISNKDEEE